MPIYEYECPNKHRFEKWQSMNDEPIRECPTCGSAVRKVVHPAGIIFKGSGWYITDSRKSGGDSESSRTEAKKESKTDGSGEPKAGGESKSSTEAKSSTETKSSD